MYVWWPLTVALCSLISAACCWLWVKRLRTNAPGPRTLPLLGNALHFWKTPAVIEHLRILHRRHGDVFRFYVGTKLFVVVTRPEDAQKVLTVLKRRDPYFLHPLQPFLKDGLVTNYGNKWKTHRRAIEPAFGREVVNRFIDTFNDEAEFVCGRLEKSFGSKLELHRFLFDGAVRSILKNSLGVRVEEVLPTSLTMDDMIDKLNSALAFTQKRMFHPWLHPDWTLFLTLGGWKLRNSAKLMDNLINKGIEIESSIPLSEEPGHKLNLADVLFGRNGGKKFPLLEVNDEVSTFLLVGSETTACTLSCILALLGLYPEWQERGVQELRDVYGKSGDYLRPSTQEDLGQLVVIESIIKETMRLLPTIPINACHMTEDVTLDSGRYNAPRGCCVVVAYSILHRQPDTFPEPDKFDPSRFLDGGSAMGRHPYSYLPFGGGPRKCIGARYAMVQMKIMLSALLRRFRFLPGSTQEELEEATLFITGRPISGYKVTCIPRETSLHQM